MSQESDTPFVLESLVITICMYVCMYVCIQHHNKPRYCTYLITACFSFIAGFHHLCKLLSCSHPSFSFRPRTLGTVTT